MYKPHLFLKSSIQAQRDFKYASEKYLNKLKFKDYCNVMDIGCGPGNITRDGLLPLLPKTLEALVGVDVSHEMIHYAKKNYQTEPKMSFRVLDILTDNIPKEDRNGFDHIFSFHCLHFIRDQSKALKNMYTMLKPGGDIFIQFLSKLRVLEFYKLLGVKNEWKPYFINYKEKMTPTNDIENPELYFKNVLESAMFNINYIASEEMDMFHPKQNYVGMLATAMPAEIPEHLREEFISETLSIAASRNFIVTNEHGEEHIHNPYTLLSAHASKAL